MASTERIIIQVNGQGIREVSRNFRALGLRAGSAGGQVGLLQKALGAVGATLVARNFLKIADSINQMENRLKIVTFGVGNLNDVFNELVEVSNRSRSALEGSVELFARVALSVRDLGLAQKEILQFTESVNKAIIVSGANAREANAGIIQLAQGLASGALRGDELRSVLEQLPFVADVIAKEFGLLRGELRKFAETGQLVTGRILKAFRDQREEIEEQFQKTIPTLAQAYVQLQTRTAAFIRGLDDSTGLTQTLVLGLQELAANLEEVATISIKVGIVLLGMFSTLALTKFIRLIALLQVRLLLLAVTNPIGIIVAALGLALGAAVAFRREIRVTADGLGDLGDLGTVAFNAIKDSLEDLPEIAERVAGRIGDAFSNINFSIADGLTLLIDTWILLLRTIQETEKTFFFQRLVGNDKKPNLFERGLDKVFQFTGGVRTIKQVKTNETIRRIGERTPGTIESLLAELEELKTRIPQITAQIETEVEKARQARLARGVAAEGPRDQELFESLRRRGQTLALLRNQPKPLGDDIIKLTDSVLKADEASRKLADGQEVIRAAFKNNEIDLLKAVSIFQALELQTEDARKPLQAFLKDLQDERDILALNGIERDKAIDRLNAEEAIRKKLPTITRENLELMLQEVDVNAIILAQTRIRDGLFQQFVQTQLDVNESLEQYNILVDAGVLKGEAQRRAFVAIRRDALLLENSFRSGLKLAVLDLGDSFDQVAFQVADTFTQVFSGLENTITDFILKGEANFRQFALTILNEITRILVRMAILQPLLQGIGGFFSSAPTSGIFGGEVVDIEPLRAASAAGPTQSSLEETRTVFVEVEVAPLPSVAVEAAPLVISDVRIEPVTLEIAPLVISDIRIKPVEVEAAPLLISDVRVDAIPFGPLGADLASSDRGGFSPAPSTGGGNTTIFQMGDVNVDVTGTGGTSEENQELASEIGKTVQGELRGFMLDIIRNEQRSGNSMNKQSVI